MDIKKWAVLLLSFLLFLSSGLAGVKPETATASDDVSYSAEFKQIYANNYDAIKADYEAGYTYVAFIWDGGYNFGECGRLAIVLSKEPLYVASSTITSSRDLLNASGESVETDTNYHAYFSSGLGWYWARCYRYYASNYDLCYSSGGIFYNAVNLPDWFSVAYVDIASCATAIPKCDLLSDYYVSDGYVAYYYYKDYPEYAFCVASGRELYVVNENSDMDNAFKYIAPVADGKKVDTLATNDKLYVYNRKLGTWSAYDNSNGGVYFRPNRMRVLFSSSHMYNSCNDGNNFTLLGSNKAIKQADFDSNGALLTEIEVSSGGTTGGWLSFPKAPVPELPETVQGITWLNLMKEVVGLVPLLVGLVISFLALRKGLSMLYHRLRKA